MAQNGNFSINVGVIDNDTIKKLKEINAELYKAQAPIRAYQRELKKFNNLSGRTQAIKKFNSSLSSLKGKFGEVKEVIGSVAKPMAALFGIGSIAGVVALTKSFSDWGNEIRNTSALLGVTSQKAIALNQAGKLAGIGDQAAGLKNYQDTQTAIQYGQNATGALANQILGINPKMDFQKAELQAIRRINSLVKAGKVNQSAARTIMQAAGFDQSLVGQDPERIAKAFREAAANAKEMAPYTKQAAEFRDHLAEAASRVDVLKTRLAASLEPALGPIIQKFIDWSKDNKAVDETMGEIATAAKSLGEWIQTIKVDDLKKDFSYLKIAVEGVIAGFVVMKAISLTAWSVGLVADIVKITTALKDMNAANQPVKFGAGGIVKNIAKAGVIGAAGYAAYYGISKAYNEIQYDRSDEGKLQGRKDILKRHDKYYSANRYSELEKNQLSNQMMDYLIKDKGFTIAQAAAKVAQYRQESGFNTQSIGDGGTAFGLKQWHPEREKAIEKKFGKSMSSMTWKEQIDADIDEEKNGEKKSGQELAAAKTIGQATKAELDNERPAEYLANGVNGTEFKNRSQLAQNAADMYQGGKIEITVHDNRKIEVKKHGNPNIADIKHTTKGGIRYG